jgi:hypothetical protein
MKATTYPFNSPVKWPDDCMCNRCHTYRVACCRVEEFFNIAPIPGVYRLLDGVRDGNLVRAEELLAGAMRAVSFPEGTPERARLNDAIWAVRKMVEAGSEWSQYDEAETGKRHLPGRLWTKMMDD